MSVIALLLAGVLACSESDEPQSKTSGSDQPASVSAGVENAPTTIGQPTTKEYRDRRLAMVTHQIEARGVRDRRVLEAMRRVPRHWFVPSGMVAHAYEDRPLPIDEGQTISQPYIVALMTESLGIEPGDRVLEVGTGSGYQAAVLSELTDKVYTVEIVAPLAESAMRVFKERGYRGIEVRVGDGYAGWPAHAPFDAIIVTCAPDRVPPPLMEQLAPGGRMCIPVGSERGVQELVLLTKQADGSTERRSLVPVRFVPMTGQAQESGG